jgi:hypothetical protein
MMTGSDMARFLGGVLVRRRLSRCGGAFQAHTRPWRTAFTDFGGDEGCNPDYVWDIVLVTRKCGLEAHMIPSPRVAATLALVVVGLPVFLLAGVVAGAFNMPWLAVAVWLALGVAFALIGALPRRWPEGIFDDADVE